MTGCENISFSWRTVLRGVRSIVASVMWFEIPQRPGTMLHSCLCVFLQGSIHTCNTCVSRGSRDAATPLCPLSRTQTVVAGREQPHNVSPGTEEASTLRLHKTLARRRIASNTTTRSTCYMRLGSQKETPVKLPVNLWRMEPALLIWHQVTGKRLQPLLK